MVRTDVFLGTFGPSEAVFRARSRVIEENRRRAADRRDRLIGEIDRYMLELQHHKTKEEELYQPLMPTSAIGGKTRTRPYAYLATILLTICGMQRWSLTQRHASTTF